MERVIEKDRVEAALGGGDVTAEFDAFQLLDALGGMLDLGTVSSEAARSIAELVKVVLGRSDVAPDPKDQRFADPAWRDNPVYRRILQSYLVWVESMDRMSAAPMPDWRRQARARFATSLITSTLAPTNLLPLNPAALKQAFDTAGLSLVKGARNFVRDVTQNGGMPKAVDTTGFVVGQNMAATPGSVVYRDDMFELVQYAPTTAKVRQRPLLMIPPQVNKYYFLDLAPGRSLTEYLVGQGVQHFTIVWRNPRPEHGHWRIDSYVAAQLRAVDVVREITGAEDVNVIGVCAGGLTTALKLGHLAATGDRPVHSATFAITMLDTSFPNTITMMATDRVFKKLEADAAAGVVYAKRDVARTFAWMRPNDLVYNYVVSGWLMGQPPPAFDILAWNEDATSLAAAFDRDMLDIYANNLAVEPGGVSVLGTPVDLSKVDVDTFVIAGVTDHITPWKPCYMTSQLFGGPSEVVITSTGHIQTIVNPPNKPRASYWAGPTPGADPDAWLAEAVKHEGSWWPHYAGWLLARSGEEKAAPRKLGSRTHAVLDAAPGSYVLEQ